MAIENQQEQLETAVKAPEKERLFRYVKLSEIEAYREQGWVVAATLGPPHGFYSILMEMTFAQPQAPKAKQERLAL